MADNNRGYFIVFEGCEGAGKTTQFNLLADRLKKLNYDILLTREPGGTKIGKQIRKILLDAKNQNLTTRTEILLYAADRAQDIRENIRPALNQGQIVLADRFIFSNLAYQGYGRGGDLQMIEQINDWVVEGCYPDLTLVLDVDIQTGLKRARDYSSIKDRLEEEKIEFHQRVREGYRQLAQQEENNCILVDANCEIDKLSARIFKLVKERLQL